MAEIYGAGRWEKEHGTAPSESWAKALGERTLNDLARGIAKAEQDSSGFVPTLGAFLGWCREFQPGTFAGASQPAEYRNEPRSLEQLMDRTSTGRAWKAYMKMAGLIPMRGSSADDLERDPEGWDVDDMRRRHRRELDLMRARYGR